MRTVIFGCPHIQSATTFGSGAIQPSIQWLVEYCKSVQATHVICLGDTVESVNKQDLLANLMVKWVLDQFKALPSQVYWMVGNHDVYSEMYNALDIFEGGDAFRVIREPTILDGEAELVLWPFQQWMDDPLQWRDKLDASYLMDRCGKPRVLFTHVPIEGMPMGGTKDKGADLKELALHHDLIFAGHYHIANQFMAEALSAETQVIVPGCLVGHDFKDLGWFHGCVVWDYMPSGGDRLHWVPNPHAHYFFKGTSAQLNAEIQRPEIAALRDRMHVRFTDQADSKPYREWGIPTVQVRPKHEQVQTSSHQSFALEGNPIEDVQQWLVAQGHSQTEELLVKAREYLA
jgi:hypothetical protein